MAYFALYQIHDSIFKAPLTHSSSDIVFLPKTPATSLLAPPHMVDDDQLLSGGLQNHYNYTNFTSIHTVEPSAVTIRGCAYAGCSRGDIVERNDQIEQKCGLRGICSDLRVNIYYPFSNGRVRDDCDAIDGDRAAARTQILYTSLQRESNRNNANTLVNACRLSLN
ncbi:hypothetical protein EVAR_43450_1 [Eumeta japonica]|uniref:Uncharacterized protein n=1 Tax=Eumeta variegata TaxID=151549 RepID=A0A4C1YCL6_EUMVA|nr:hypothetical protein EVAR_43450_1 [Eumeta japonica]